MVIPLGQRMVLAASHHDPCVNDAQPYVVITSGNKFGTGTHPTTRICVALLEQILTEGQTVLDLGTGTGILAICAARLLAKHVVAIDHDFDACKIAAHNIIHNGMGRTVRVIHGRLEALSDRARFDIVLANLEFHILRGVIPLFKNHLRPHGFLVTSGVQGIRRADLENALATSGFITVSSHSEGEWIGVLSQEIP